jgi:hypothetical protein
VKKNQVNRIKASSHPLQPGGVYIGVVRYHDSQNTGRPTIFVPQLGVTFKDVEYVGNTTRGSLKANDRVLCTFIDMETSEIFIIGAFNKKQDVFAGKEKFNSLIDELQTRINQLQQALSLTQTSFTTFKQTD